MIFNNLFVHPSALILFLTTCLAIARKNLKIFNIIAISIPLLSLFFIYFLPEKTYLHIYNLTLIYDGSFYNKLIVLALLIALFAASLASISFNRKLEIILGNGYAAFSIMCVLSGDYLSLFVGLELMMILSTIIIFIGGNRHSTKAAKNYFFTHLVSGNLILSGLIYLISRTGSTEIFNISVENIPELVDIQRSFPIYLMLTGMVINIASFPFSGWMTNYYTEASSSGFLYLISFTTKVSVVILAKFFAGFEILKYIAVLMICYSLARVLFEDHILKFLCYYSIISMGFMTLGICTGDKEIFQSVICYLFIHIIYKSLLSICSVYYINATKIIRISNLIKTDNKIIITGAVLSLSMLLSLPLTIAYSAKTTISGAFSEGPIYILIFLLTFVTCYSLPWKQYFIKNTETFPIRLDIYGRINLITLSAILLFTIFCGHRFLHLNNAKLFDYKTLLHLIIISCSIFASYIYFFKRNIQESVNLIELAGRLFIYLFKLCINKISIQEKQNNTEPLGFDNLKYLFFSKIKLLHNQQTAIFIVFSALVIMSLA